MVEPQPQDQTVNQTVDSNQGNVQGGAAGRDANFYQDNKQTVNVNINPALPSQLEELPSNRILFNYVSALIFLIALLIWWLILGFFAKHEFPVEQIISLVQASFRGNSMWQEVKRQYRDKADLDWESLKSDSMTQQEYKRLSREESELWLIKKLIEIITSGSSRDKEIDKVIEILEKQRQYVYLSLVPLRKKFDADWNNLQADWMKFGEGYSLMEADYKKINKILGGLVSKYAINSKSTPDKVDDLVNSLQEIVINNSYDIDLSRIETLHNVLQLLKWAIAVDQDGLYQYEFKADVDSIRRQRAIDLIVEQAKEVLSLIITNIDTQSLDSIELGIRNQWLCEISLYGLNYAELAIVELALEIDWDRFNSRRNRSASSEIIKIKWNSKRPIEIDKAIDLFNKILRANRLQPTWRVRCSPGLDAEEICRKLGFHDSPIYWDKAKLLEKAQQSQIQDLSEFGIGIQHFRGI
jgi:hypothetical protein